MRRLRISTQPISTTRSPSLACRPVVSVSSTTCLGIAGDPLVGERVSTLVLRMTRVSLDPVPLHAVRAVQFVELLPQIDILHRLLVRGAPALALPAADPFRNALLHVLRVGVDAHPPRRFEPFQRPEHGRQVHSRVCTLPPPPRKIFLVV